MNVGMLLPKQLLFSIEWMNDLETWSILNVNFMVWMLE